MHPVLASLALAGAISAVVFAVAPYREPVQLVEQTVNRPIKDQSRLPQGAIISHVVKTVSYRQVPMPRPRPERRRAHR
jgi:amino acid transporter